MFCANLQQAVLVCDALVHKNKQFNKAIQLSSVSVLCTLKNTAAQQYFFLNDAIQRLTNTAGWSSTLHPVTIFNRSQLRGSPHVAAGHPFNLMRYGPLPAGPMSGEAINIYFQIMPRCTHCDLLYHSPALRRCSCMHVYICCVGVCVQKLFFSRNIKLQSVNIPCFVLGFSPLLCNFMKLILQHEHKLSQRCSKALNEFV